VRALSNGGSQDEDNGGSGIKPGYFVFNFTLVAAVTAVFAGRAV
jgi:hypothetical protein